jgi:hypothetical protein
LAIETISPFSGEDWKAMRLFLRLWVQAFIKPKAAFEGLKVFPGRRSGLIATLLRFGITALTSILSLAMLERRPFVDPVITFIPLAQYYWFEIFFLPLFGLTAWWLSGWLVSVVLRLRGVKASRGWILNVIGFSLLAVMPVVWVLDWTTIALGVYGASFTIPIHALVSVWEIGLMAVGFMQIEGVSSLAAIGLGALVKVGVYIPLAAVLVR